MSAEPASCFGFELLYKVSGAQVAKKEDVLILLVHWYLCKSGFKCLGSGDSKTIDSSEVATEILPDDWNKMPNYSLRYVKDGKLYILMGIKSDADLIINLLRIEDHSVSNVQFPIDMVKELQGPLKSLIPNYEEIINSLKNNLVEPVYTGSCIEVSTQTSESQSNRPRNDFDDPLRVDYRYPEPFTPRFRQNDPLRIGQGDLHPFGGVGAGGEGAGGMLFDPFRRENRPVNPGLGIPGRLPPGAVPPGARFDPFGPPDANPLNPRGRVPDADHMPPPGYDDMFM